MSEEATESISIRTTIPRFSGEEKDFPFFKTKFKAWLAKSKLTKLLTWKSDIRKDDYTWATNYDADKKKEEELIQKQNIQANGALIQAIDIDTDAGKATFYQVEKYIDDDYAGGHFLNAWKGLCDRFDETEVVDKTDLQQEYFDMKMADADDPSLFIVKLERMKKRLKGVGIEIDEADFLEPSSSQTTQRQE